MFLYRIDISLDRKSIYVCEMKSVVPLKDCLQIEMNIFATKGCPGNVDVNALFIYTQSKHAPLNLSSPSC